MLKKRVQKDLNKLSVALIISVILMFIAREYTKPNLFIYTIPLIVGIVGYVIVLIRASKEK